MRKFLDPISVKPDQYEKAVKRILDAAARGLVSYKSDHREVVGGEDGEYVIDVVATFEALGANFMVLVECKHHKRKVERRDVQVLYDKLRSTGGQKGMLFSVSGFQAGAIEYAEAHGIALVQFADGKSTWFAKGANAQSSPPPWVNFPAYVGWWHRGKSIAVLSEDHPEYARQALGLDPVAD